MHALRSERIVEAIKTLTQFAAAEVDVGQPALQVLTGALVAASPDPDQDDHGMLDVAFPGREAVMVDGMEYLQLQVTEHARLLVDGARDRGPVPLLVHSTMEMLTATWKLR